MSDNRKRRSKYKVFTLKPLGLVVDDTGLSTEYIHYHANDNYLQPKPWVLISNRKNDYEVDSSGFQYVALAPYLIGAAIVSKKYTKSDAHTLGRGYLGKPLHIYSTLENAYEWANALLKKS